MLGLRELAMVAAVVLVLYGRSGVLRSQRFQSIWPWIAPVRRKPVSPRAAGVSRPDAPHRSSVSPGSGSGVVRKARIPRLDGNRLFWFLTILAATAVATMIITRSLVLQGTGTGAHH